MLNFQQFLMSSSGGAWKIGEIKRGTHINSSVATTIEADQKVGFNPKLKNQVF